MGIPTVLNGGSQVAYLQIRAGERLVAQLSRSRTPRRFDALCEDTADSNDVNALDVI